MQGFPLRNLFYLQPFFIPLIRRDCAETARESKEKNRIVSLVTTTMLFLFFFNLFLLLGDSPK